MTQNYGVREVRRGKKWGWWLVLAFAMMGLIVGYREEYKPRIEAKNYASYAAIVLAGVEIKLTAFESADEAGRQQILQSLPALWQKFCEIDCPSNPRTDEIQWKMAKLLDYTRIFFGQTLSPVHSEWQATPADIQERIADLNLLINDTIEYGNFKRLK